MLWYKDNDETMVAMDKTVVSGDRRVTVTVTETGSTLRIGGATVDDSGEYICQIASSEKPEIKHRVTVASE